NSTNVREFLRQGVLKDSDFDEEDGDPERGHEGEKNEGNYGRDERHIYDEDEVRKGQ
ncbi:unnamed protein product, partial [Heterotrigona itama]